MDVRINYFSADEAKGYGSNDESRRRVIQDEKYDSSDGIEKFEKEPESEGSFNRSRPSILIRIKHRTLKIVKFMFSKFMLYFWGVIASWGLQETILAFL